MITFEVLSRIFHIRFGSQVGTAFTLDIDNKQYLVTARHVVSEMLPNDKLGIYHDDQWKSLLVKRLVLPALEVDIAVLVSRIQLSPHKKRVLRPDTTNCQLGTDIYLLGFPYGEFTQDEEVNRNFPIPLVKQGIISGMGPTTTKPTQKYWLLDGNIAPGFSGGPVILRNSGDPSELDVIGVISSFRWQQEPIWQEDNTPAAFFYKHNTGISVAYDIRFAIEAIEANPIGYSLSP